MSLPSDIFSDHKACAIFLFVSRNPGVSLAEIHEAIGLRHKSTTQRLAQRLTQRGTLCVTSSKFTVRNDERNDERNDTETVDTARVSNIYRAPDSEPLKDFKPYPIVPSLKNEKTSSGVSLRSEEKNQPDLHSRAIELLEQIYAHAGISNPPAPGHPKYLKFIEHLQDTSELLKHHDFEKIKTIAGYAIRDGEIERWGSIITFGMLPYKIKKYEPEWIESENLRLRKIEQAKRQAERQQEEYVPAPDAIRNYLNQPAGVSA